jgi:glycosidase
MNYIFTRACIGFFGAQSLSDLYPGGGYDKIKAMDAQAFATSIESLLNLYHWEITLAQMNLLSSHDTPRFVHMVQEDRSALRLAMLVMMTMPGAPTVYYGDEVGLTGGYDPGSRGAMPWDESEWDVDLHHYVRETIRLRKSHPALRRGTYRMLLAQGAHFAFERVHEGQRIVIAFNTATSSAPISIPIADGAAGARVLFGQPGDIQLTSDILRLQIPGRTGVVIGLDR